MVEVQVQGVDGSTALQRAQQTPWHNCSRAGRPEWHCCLAQRLGQCLCDAEQLFRALKFISIGNWYCKVPTRDIAARWTAKCP